MAIMLLWTLMYNVCGKLRVTAGLVAIELSHTFLYKEIVVSVSLLFVHAMAVNGNKQYLIFQPVTGGRVVARGCCGVS